MSEIRWPLDSRVDQTEPQKQPLWSEKDQFLPIFDEIDPSEGE